jgi:hypothetical protein
VNDQISKDERDHATETDAGIPKHRSQRILFAATSTSAKHNIANAISAHDRSNSETKSLNVSREPEYHFGNRVRRISEQL